MKAEVALPFILQAPSHCAPRARKNFDPFTDSLECLNRKLKARRQRGNKKISPVERSSSSWTSALSHHQDRRQMQPKPMSVPPPNAPSGSPLQRLGGERRLISLPSRDKNMSPRLSPLSQSKRFILPARQKELCPMPSMQPMRRLGGLVLESKGAVKTGKSPQEHLDSLLIERGYETTLYRSIDTAFYNRPTQWQIASYGPALIQAVRSGDVKGLRELLSHLSANPCTSNGESLWHMVCRRGNVELLQVLLEHEQALELCQSVNDHGRTPLHDALWAAEPAFDLVRVLLDRNPILLFLKDTSNNTPLSYIPAQQWPVWIEFLSRHVDEWFPSAGFTSQYKAAISWVHKPPNFIPLTEAPPISTEMACNLASGKSNVILEWATESDFFSEHMDQEEGVGADVISDVDELSSADLDDIEDSSLLRDQRMLMYANFSPAAMPGIHACSRSE